MSEEKLYQFNEYVLGYDKGHNDRSCLTISKIQNDNMYVMSSLYDGSADVISLMLDSLQEELIQTKLLNEKYQLKKDKQKEVLDDIKENLKNIDFEYLRLTNNHCLADYLERLLKLLEEIE